MQVLFAVNMDDSIFGTQNLEELYKQLCENRCWDFLCTLHLNFNWVTVMEFGIMWFWKNEKVEQLSAIEVPTYTYIFNLISEPFQISVLCLIVSTFCVEAVFTLQE